MYYLKRDVLPVVYWEGLLRYGLHYTCWFKGELIVFVTTVAGACGVDLLH